MHRRELERSDKCRRLADLSHQLADQGLPLRVAVFSDSRHQLPEGKTSQALDSAIQFIAHRFHALAHVLCQISGLRLNHLPERPNGGVVCIDADARQRHNCEQKKRSDQLRPQFHLRFASNRPGLAPEILPRIAHIPQISPNSFRRRSFYFFV
jgi:hypothetical protein